MSGGDVVSFVGEDSSGEGVAPLAALQRAVDARDWAAAAAAVREGWYGLLTEERGSTTDALARVPADARQEEPLLALELSLASAAQQHQRARTLRSFVEAVRAAHEEPESTPAIGRADRLLIRTAETAAYRLLGRTEDSMAAAERALDLAEHLDAEEREALGDLPRIYAVIGVSLYYGGEPEEALEAAAHGLAEAPPSPPSNGMGSLALLAGVNALRGDLTAAREYIDYARTGPWTDDQRNGYSGTLYRIAEAVLALERFDPDAARVHVESTARGLFEADHWPTIAQVRAMTGLVAGRPGHALAELDAFAAEHGTDGRSPRSRAELARVRSLLQLALGNPDAAAAIVRRDIPGGPVAHVERARVALALGQTGTALSELRPIAGERLSTRQAAETAAIEAAILLRISATPRRESVVQRLGELLERSGQRLPILLLPPGDVLRVVDALREAGYARVVEGIPHEAVLRSVEPDVLLTKRELAVLEQLMATGSVSAIAAALSVSANTVKSQVRGLYRKLGVTNREDAVAVALERHLHIERD